MIENFKKIYSLVSFEKKKIFFLFFFILISCILEILSVAIILPIILFISKPEIMSEYFFSKYLMNIGYSQNQIILLVVFFFFLIFLIKFLYLSWLAWYKAKIIYNCEYRISKKILALNLKKDFSFFNQTNSSNLINLAINQSSIFAEYGLKAIFNFFSDLFVVLGILLMLVYFEPFITIISLVFIGSSFYFIINFTKTRAQKWSEEKIISETNRIRQLNEILGLIKNIKLGSFENKFFSEFNNFTKKSTYATQNQFFLISLPRLFVEFSAISVFTIILFLMYVLDSLSIELLPKLALMAAGAFRILPALGVIQSCIVNIRFVKPTIVRIESLLDVKERNFDIYSSLKKEISFDSNLIKKSNSNNFLFNKELLIKNVSFFYDKKKDLVFDKINMSLKFGEIVGIIGKSGSGKSSLINLITGITRPQKGEILIDGININKNLKKWQKNIGYVAQNIHLMDASIKENIAFGDIAGKENLQRVLEVIKSSNLVSFIKNLDKGIDSSVGEKGSMISGGQMQRIGIARGLYYNPRLLILDESTNALDNETEKEILFELKKLKGKVTLMIISHKMQTLKICDQIYRVEDKKIIKI